MRARGVREHPSHTEPRGSPRAGRLRAPRQGLNPGSPGWLLTAHFTDGDRGLEVCGRGGSCVRSPDPARASPAQRGRAGAQALPGGALMGPWLCVASSPLTTTRKDQPRGQGVGAHGSLPHTLPATALGSTTPPGVQLESGRTRSPPGCQALPGVTWGHCRACLGTRPPSAHPRLCPHHRLLGRKAPRRLGTATGARRPPGQTSRGNDNNPCPKKPSPTPTALRLSSCPAPTGPQQTLGPWS